MILFREFLELPSPPGREEQTAELVREKLSSLGCESETDAAGNVLVRVAGRDAKAPPVICSAHMDEIGVVVTKLDSGGILRVDKSGGLYPWKIGECPLEILGDRETVPGVLSMGSVHSRGMRQKSSVLWEDVYVHTGLSPEELAAAGVRPGTQAVPDRSVRGPVFLGKAPDPLVGAWTFDDTVDMVNLVLLLKELRDAGTKPVRNLVAAFTVQEEVGCHGAKFLAGREHPELFVALDGLPLLPHLDLALDGCPGVWSRDALIHFDPAVLETFIGCGKEVGVTVKTGVFDGAASDASAAFAAGLVPRAATIGHIRDNSHGFEVTRLSSVENARKVLRRFLETWER
jgi:putative aminopeptidase FrvX